MPEDLNEKFERMAQQVEATYRSVEKMRKFFMWTLIITVAMFILPLIGLIFMIPRYLDMINSLYTI